MVGFGHAPFGHFPFGHASLSTTVIQDLAYNPLASPSSMQMLGWVEPTSDEDVLSIEIYKFFFESIRTEDKINGNLFLKRFLQGPQAVWEATQTKISDIKKLWDINEIEDEHLQYQKNIVGWTSDLENITDSLDYDTLRRLIANSVALWKQRGPEGSLLNLLTLLANVNARIWNWFDFRWVLGRTTLDVANEGNDPWVINLPSSPDMSEYYSNLRIVDDGALNHSVIEAATRLMRAAGERIIISYIDFMDLFYSKDNTTQWDIDSYNFVISEGSGKLIDDTQSESVIINIEDSQYWTEYVCAWRFKGTSSGGKAGVLFYASDIDNGFVLSPNFGTSQLRLYTIISGTWSYVDYYENSFVFREDSYYMLKVQIVPENSSNKIVAFVDGVDIGFKLNSSFSAGKIGLVHEINSTATLDEVELFQMPLETKLIDINS